MRESKGVKTWRRNEINVADPRLWCSAGVLSWLRVSKPAAGRGAGVSATAAGPPPGGLVNGAQARDLSLCGCSGWGAPHGVPWLVHSPGKYLRAPTLGPERW